MGYSKMWCCIVYNNWAMHYFYFMMTICDLGWCQIMQSLNFPNHFIDHTAKSTDNVQCVILLKCANSLPFCGCLRRGISNQSWTKTPHLQSNYAIPTQQKHPQYIVSKNRYDLTNVDIVSRMLCYHFKIILTNLNRYSFFDYM